MRNAPRFPQGGVPGPSGGGSRALQRSYAEAPDENLAVDHVILLVDDLGRAAEWMLTEHGLASAEGGRHVGHGTANRIVPLGEAYLELLAVVDPMEAAGSPFGRWVSQNTGHEPRLAALCLRTEDAAAVAARLGLEPVAMSRIRPDGTELAWALVGYEEMLEEGLPFFIEWQCPPDEHPGRSQAPHPTVPTGTVHITLSGDPVLLGRRLGDHDLPIEIVPGAAGVSRVAVETRRGAVVLT